MRARWVFPLAFLVFSAAPAGTVDPGIRAADEAGIRERFRHVAHSKEHASHGLGSARAHVAAYVEFLHHVEGLHAAAAAAGHHGEGPANHAAHVE